MFKQLLRQYTAKPPDWKLIIAFGALIVFGLLVLSSASAPLSFQRFGTAYYYVTHQILYGVLPGLVLFLFFSLVDYTVWKKYALVMLGVSLVLLVLVFIPGIGAEFGTARSWIVFGNISMQPSEFVKLTFLMYLATWLAQRGHAKAQDLHEGLLPFAVALGMIVFLLLLQPDTGSMMIIAVMAMTVYFVGGANIRHVIAIVGAGLAGLLLLIKLSPYRTARFMTFLHPELDPQGIGYHINQAFLAIGSGGLFGRGFGLSRQKYQYLPEVMGDSIFAILSEELGFFIAAATVALFVYVMLRGFKVAMSAKDAFGKYLVVGVIAWFTTQAFFNIGAMAGVLPLTGVPLPFVSYGGSATLVGMAAMGLVANVSRSAKLEK